MDNVYVAGGPQETPNSNEPRFYSDGTKKIIAIKWDYTPETFEKICWLTSPDHKFIIKGVDKEKKEREIQYDGEEPKIAKVGDYICRDHNEDWRVPSNPLYTMPRDTFEKQCHRIPEPEISEEEQQEYEDMLKNAGAKIIDLEDLPAELDKLQ